MLQSAMQLSVQQAAGADEDLIDYNNLLRHGALRCAVLWSAALWLNAL